MDEGGGGKTVVRVEYTFRGQAAFPKESRARSRRQRAKNDFFATRFPSSMPNGCLVVVADEPMNLHQLLPAAWIELFFEEEVSLASVCGWN